MQFYFSSATEVVRYIMQFYFSSDTEVVISRPIQKLFPRRTDATGKFVRQFGKVI
jgi:hypothetical protein